MPRASTASFLTIGHGSRPLADFLSLLSELEVRCVADLRIPPGSRTNRDFNSDNLRQTLEEAGLQYRQLPALAGRRRPSRESPNQGLRNIGLRGFADHMATPEFAEGLDDLVALSAQGDGEPARVAILCSELVPWRCHRSLVADALVAQGHAVDEVIGKNRVLGHQLTLFAREEDGHLRYPLQLPFEAES
jgi:uncharacterized protein (DUF488 family)